jgi:beta-lactamase regulating signal transducer with metallopeptidase domain
LGRHLNPRWRYALWLLVLTRLVLPVQPESALSLFRFTPAPPAAVTVSMTHPIFEAQPASTESPVSASQVPPRADFSIYSILSLVWLAGAVVLGMLTVEVNRRFARQVAGSPTITDPAILDIFTSARAELPIRRQIRLVESCHITSPAIMGLFRPTLLLPVDVRETFEPEELRFIFLHELAHLKRGDVIVQNLIGLLQVLHWFNPLLWFAFRRMRADREPATDALVLSRAGEDEKELYGLMLLKLLEHFHQRHSLPTLVGILEDKDPFKRRFQLIARFTRGSYGWSLLGVILIALLSIACLTKRVEKGSHSDDSIITFSGSVLIFKMDSHDSARGGKYRAVLKSPTYQGLNKINGFVLLGSVFNNSLHSSDFTSSKNPRPDHSWSISTSFHIRDVTVDVKLRERPTASDAIEMTAELYPRDAKGNSLGVFTSQWTQPVGKDGVILLAPGGQNFVAPQSDGSHLGYFVQIIIRKDVKAGDHPLAASDKMVDVQMENAPSDMTSAGILPSNNAADRKYFDHILNRDHVMVADSTVISSTLQADAKMLLAVQKGDVSALREVLEHGVDPNTFDPTVSEARQLTGQFISTARSA